eukprot:12908007-Prorocentrum_lima.AAC.1
MQAHATKSLAGTPLCVAAPAGRLASAVAADAATELVEQGPSLPKEVKGMRKPANPIALPSLPLPTSPPAPRHVSQ